MSSSLGYSLIEGNSNLQPKIKNNNATRKHYPKQKVTLETMENQENDVNPLDENDESDDDNWNPPPRAELTQTRDNNKKQIHTESEQDDDEPALHRQNEPVYNFQQQENQYNPQYQNNQNNEIPQYFQENFQGNDMQPESELNKKINYMIQLLEEQHDEKIKSVTEEVILYGFLGVFIIYIVDGFAKIGKYVR